MRRTLTLVNVKIQKRDGRIVDFDQNKIIDAVLAAFKEVDGEITEYAEIKAGNISDYVYDYCENLPDGKVLNIEEIQDLVERGLMSLKRKDVAKAYILYRDKRTKERNWNSAVMKTVKEKLEATNIKNQNANVDEHSFGGRMGEANDAVMKQYALDNCMSEMSRNNHLNNEIYIHDLSAYPVGMHNCLSIPFDDLLANGFNVRQTDIRPANSVNTAFQLLAVIFQTQSLCQFGGVSATHLDWTMVPYVRKSFRKHYIDGLKYIENIFDEELFEHIPMDAGINDEEYKIYPKAYKYAMDMTKRETKQAAEGMFHNLNSLQSRSGK